MTRTTGSAAIAVVVSLVVAWAAHAAEPNAPATRPASRPALNYMSLFTAGESVGPNTEPPGLPFDPPARNTAQTAPAIYSHTGEAGPDETFLLVGRGLDGNVTLWGESDSRGAGQPYAPVVHYATGEHLSATVPQEAYDGVFLLWAGSEQAGYSQPVVLNAPEAWWALPEVATPGGTVEVFGRNLARRPDFDRAYVWAQKPDGSAGRWLDVTACDKYRLAATVPPDWPEDANEMRLWAHTGKGGRYGWSEPVTVRVRRPRAPKVVEVCQASESSLREALTQAATSAPAVVQLPAGEIRMESTLKVPAGVVVRGAGRDRTRLCFDGTDEDKYTVRPPADWKATPTGPGNRGDQLYYLVDVPASGKWTAWIQYAWVARDPAAKAAHHIKVGRDEPVQLAPLAPTGDWGSFRWSRAGDLDLQAGQFPLAWEHPEAQAVHVRAIVLSREEGFTPADKPYPASDAQTIVLQGESVVRHVLTYGDLPGEPRVAAWLSGDGAGLSNLSVQGSGRIDTGVLIRHDRFPRWISGSHLVDCDVTGIEGKRMENRGVHFQYAEDARVTGCELWARVPVYFAGARGCDVRGNRLVPQTRFGGGAEGTILGRQNIIERCVIADNVVASPTGQQAGAGANRRMIWLSTGHGSVHHNYIARNRTERARFIGLGGTDQNVGETILFEACQSYAFLGKPASADRQSLTLPQTIEATPEGRLGSSRRESLAHDPAGNETPFLPPDAAVSDGVFETPAQQYYVMVVSGTGVGQARRVNGRDDHTLKLDLPWHVAPDANSLVLVTTLFYRNLVVDNGPRDGMSGIQLWFNCFENIVADNEVSDQRRGGISLHAARETLASSQRRTWNRGVAPSWFNTFQGNRVIGVSDGGILAAVGSRNLPVEFPLLLGNVMRHNSFLDCRGYGFVARGSQGVPSPDVVGSIVELNLVRSPSLAAYAAGEGVDQLVLRRNHAWFWQPPAGEGGHAFFEYEQNGKYVLDRNEAETSHAGRGPIQMQRKREDRRR